MGISSLNQKKSKLPSNSAYSIFSNYETLAETSKLSIEFSVFESGKIVNFNWNK